MGSTYEVLHNLRNLKFVIQEIAPKLLKLNSNIMIQIFGNRLPPDLELPSNCKYLGFDVDLQSRIVGSAGVIIPFHGGAGMQSKVFESLALGGKVIANPKSLVGYPFEEGLHYVGATDVHQYISAMLRMSDSPKDYEPISTEARRLSEELFNENILLANTIKAVSSISGN